MSQSCVSVNKIQLRSVTSIPPSPIGRWKPNQHLYYFCECFNSRQLQFCQIPVACGDDTEGTVKKRNTDLLYYFLRFPFRGPFLPRTNGIYRGRCHLGCVSAKKYILPMRTTADGADNKSWILIPRPEISMYYQAGKNLVSPLPINW